ncbi:MAG: hypothetical protein HYV07_20400 [Deltaproteobacteria bacterium]|nr:hypothetical protein [Deltaproteobacteria bacterium]
MHRLALKLAEGLLLAIALGCQDDAGPSDAGSTFDASRSSDASSRDASSQDAAADASTSTPGDASSGGDAAPLVDVGMALDATANDASSARDAGGAPSTLAEAHPGDLGMGADPAVIWFEDFEAGSLAAITARYDQSRDNGRMTLVTDTPRGSGFALALRAGGSEPAIDLYKQLPDADEWFVRWYARYEADGPWHHSGMWFGGYAPASRWPSPNAGRRPAGDDRFSIAVEPVFDGPRGKRFDFYNYWMGMHSWMAEPVNDNGSAYWGNALVHQNDFTVDAETWVCLEVHARLNDDPSSAAGAVLEVWKNDALVQRFDDSGPAGYWIRDKFCPEGADGTECTDYPSPANQVLDLQMRSTSELKLNAFWPQNYVTDPASATLTFDQMVVATRRVGCLR